MPLTIRNCVICRKEFRPTHNPLQTCCSLICSKSNNRNRCNKWHKEKRADPAFVEAERARGRVYAQNPVNRARMLQRHKLYRLTHHQQDVDYHRNNSAQVRHIWSRGVNGRFSWLQAEDIALQILSLEGFENIILLKQFKGNFYFDIKAVRKQDNKICVFQVTTRTHTEVKRRLSYAKIFYLDFYILYVRPDLTGYILKYAEGPGSQALSCTDMQKIKATTVTVE
jgi:hypothetical protein